MHPVRRPEGGQEAAAHGPRGWGRTRGAGAHGCAVNRRNVVAVSVSPRTRRGVPPTRVVSLGPEVLEARETVVLHAKRTKRAGDGNRKNPAPVGIDTEVTIGGQSYVLRAVAVHVGDFADSGHWKAYRHVSSTTAPTVAAWCPPSPPFPPVGGQAQELRAGMHSLSLRSGTSKGESRGWCSRRGWGPFFAGA